MKEEKDISLKDSLIFVGFIISAILVGMAWAYMKVGIVSSWIAVLFFCIFALFGWLEAFKEDI